MKKILIGISIMMMVILSGCTTGAVSATTAPPPCNLSILKIKTVKIEGDREDFVSRALKSELYKRGAKIDANGGVEVMGAVIWGTMAPLEISVEVATMAFSSTAQSGAPLATTSVGSEYLAKQVADDFCQCLAGIGASGQPIKK